MVLLIVSTTPQLRSSAYVYSRWKCKQSSVLYGCSLQYTVRSVNLVVPEFARRQHHRRTDSVTEIHTDSEYFCVVRWRYQWLRYCNGGDRWMNTKTDERMFLNYWWKYGDRGKQNRTYVVTNDQSEAFLNSVQHSKVLVEELLAPRPTHILEDYPCRLSETGYAMYLQLPSVQEFVPSSATWGRAMPWWQGLIAQGKTEGIGERCLNCCFIHHDSYDGLILTKSKYWEKNVRVLFLSPQIPHEPTWDCNRACTVRTRGLTVLAIVRPGINVGRRYGMDSSGCGCGLMAGSPVHCSEFSASINDEKFLDKESKC